MSAVYVRQDPVLTPSMYIFRSFDSSHRGIAVVEGQQSREGVVEGESAVHRLVFTYHPGITLSPLMLRAKRKRGT